MTALAALRLVERKRLSLDKPVNTALRCWKIPDSALTERSPVTLRQLLSHTAGLTVSGFAGYRTTADVPSLRQVLDSDGPANSAPIRVDTVPGTRYRYSGGGYTVVQQLFVDVADRSFPETVAELVLTPLGMTDSGFEQPPPAAVADRLATAHDRAGEPVPGGAHVHPELAAAGLWSTPQDLARLALALLDARRRRPSEVVSERSAGRMLTPVLGDAGLGMFVTGSGRTTRFIHAGSNRGFRCYLIGLPATGQGAVVMTNGSGGADLAQEIIRAVATVYGWPGEWQRRRRAVAVEADVLAAYPGTYRLGQTDIQVSLRDGRLYAEAPGSRRSELLASDDDRFFSLGKEWEVSFEVADDGDRATALVLHAGGREYRAGRVAQAP